MLVIFESVPSCSNVRSAPAPKTALALSANSKASSDLSNTIFADAPVKVTSSLSVDVPLTSIFPFKSTFPSCTAPSSVTVPVIFIPVASTANLVVNVPAVITCKLSFPSSVASLASTITASIAAKSISSGVPASFLPL